MTSRWAHKGRTRRKFPKRGKDQDFTAKPDPIDTYYWPSPAELAKTFGRSKLLIGEEVAETTYAEELKARGISVASELMRTVLWALIFFARPRSAAARLHRWRWYSRPRRVAIALLAVRGQSA